MTKSKAEKILYLGSGNFAASLSHSLEKEFPSLVVATQKYKNNPFLNSIFSKKIPIYEINSKKGLISFVDRLAPKKIIVADFGIILPSDIFAITDLVVNIHPSLLPKYRGPSPIVTAILNGDRKSGVSILKMAEEIDAGPVYMEEEIQIEDADTSQSLRIKLSELAQKMIRKYMKKILTGKILPKVQDDKKAVFTRLFQKNDGLLDTKESAIIIERKIRAFHPWPSVFFTALVNEKKTNIKILEATVTKNKCSDPLCIKTGKDFLKITKLQPEGKRVMTAEEFLRGHKIEKIL